MHRASLVDMQKLEDFLKRSVEKGNEGVLSFAPNPQVTALMYFFWTSGRASTQWPRFEGALLETWRNCGLLKTVLVVNEAHACVREFASHWANVEVQVEPRLIPGDINTMSIDCNERLFSRFGTPYVLVVQDDGFPVRKGLDEFVELGYDFIGSPYCRPLPIPNLLTRLLNFCPSNGGFSLRSQKLCRLAAQYWKRDYAQKPFVVLEMSEDLFMTQTLPLHHLGFWLRRRQAPSAIAERFSYEGAFPLQSKIMPFGFHTATGFAGLSDAFGLEKP